MNSELKQQAKRFRECAAESRQRAAELERLLATHSDMLDMIQEQIRGHESLADHYVVMANRLDKKAES